MFKRSLISVCVLASLLGASQGAAAQTSSAGVPRVTVSSWMITGSNMSKIGRTHRDLASAIFDRQSAYGLGNPDADQVQVPDGYRAVPTLIYRSLARFRADVGAHRIHPGIKAVMYDPESWGDTPIAEQNDPITAMHSFANLAHAHHYQVVLAPARDLMGVTTAVCQKTHETNDAAYLRWGCPPQPGGRRTSS